MTSSIQLVPDSFPQSGSHDAADVKEVYLSPLPVRPAAGDFSEPDLAEREDAIILLQEKDYLTTLQDEEDFRDGHVPQPSDVFIAVMGVTGAGKSTLISLCTDKEVRIGKGLQACTQEVSTFQCKYRPDMNVYLIDTPGFDDTNRSDTEVLKEIAAWLKSSYENSIRLRGIIYLHRISDMRMPGSAKKNLLMFKKLCGPDALKHVILATDMWENVPHEVGEDREKELMNTPEFWGWMIQNGSRVVRHYNNKESAMKLIEAIINKPTLEAEFTTALQDEMVKQGKPLNETSAGEELDNALAKEREKFEKELAEVMANLKEVIELQDKEAAQALEEQRIETEERVRQLKQDQENLKKDLERSHQEKYDRLREEFDRSRNETRKTVKQLESMRTEQERQRKLYHDEAKSHLEANSKHTQELEKLQKRISELSVKPKVENTSTKTDNAVDAGPVSVSLYGIHYFWCAANSWARRVASTFAKDVEDEGGDFQYVALGNNNSYYIHYHVKGKCWTLRSGSFSNEYPALEQFIKEHEQYGCPGCVSLGPSGRYFMRSEWGSAHNLSDDTKKHLGEMSKVESLWLGKDSSYVAVMKDGAKKWDLKGYYSRLEQYLRGGPIKALAMNPKDGDQFALVRMDGWSVFNQGTIGTFDPADYKEWTRKNFALNWS